MILNTKTFLTLIASGFLFAASVNLFLRPIGIYNGGVVGISQLLSDAINNVLKLSSPLDLTGILNFILNIPIFMFGWFKLSKKFIKLSITTVLIQSIFMTLIPIPTTPIVADVFISILAAVLIGAYGASLAFKVKGSSGGLDIIGMYFSKQKKGKVGTIYLLVNSCIYAVCIVLYNLEIAIYSIVYSTLFSYALDKFHHHNIEVSVTVFTKNREIKHIITQEMMRGVTYWNGFGAYTNTDREIIMTIVAQSEVGNLKKLIKKNDPEAFIVINQNLTVDGGFEKRLI